MKPSTVLYVLGGTIFAVDFYAGLKSSGNNGNLPSWYPQTLVNINANLPVNLAYILLGLGVASHYFGY